MPGYVVTNFFIYAIVNAFTPGPGNILALNTVTNYGWKNGKRLFFGIFAPALAFLQRSSTIKPYQIKIL